MAVFISPDTVSQKAFIGLMSGTSMDGVDGVLAYFTGSRVEVLASTHIVMPEDLRTACLALNQPGQDELHHAAIASIKLSHWYAEAVKQLLDQAQFASKDIAAIGCHGQTVRHQPRAGYTLQLVNGALLAELTGITSIVDFRSRDIAAGGQGAPLVPAFHQAVFGSPHHARGIVNIGGFSNLSALRPDCAPIGFDCGPGNALLNAWIFRHQGLQFDSGGAWASTGTLNMPLFNALMGHPFFKQPPPRSTGREDFHLNWLDAILIETHTYSLPPEDIQRTLLELTARTITDAILQFTPELEEVYLCGGGTFNLALVKRLKSLLSPRHVKATGQIGVPEDQVEALAFAWLAQRTVMGEAGNLSSVTGARGARILGAIYPA